MMRKMWMILFFISVCIIIFVPVCASEDIKKFGPFVIDDKNLYKDMEEMADGRGILSVEEGTKIVYVPWIVWDENIKIKDETIKIVLKFKPEAEAFLEKTEYELIANLAESKSGTQNNAWLMEWAPEWKEDGRETLTAGKSIIANIHIEAITVEDVSVVVEDELTIQFTLKEVLVPPESEMLPEETVPEETQETPEESMPEETESDMESTPSIDYNEEGYFGGHGGTVVEEVEPNAKIRLLHCETDIEEIKAGDEVLITAVLKNISDVSAVEDIRIVYESVSGEIVPVNASNSIYVDYIGMGDTYTISFPVKVAYVLTTQQQKITLSMEYTDKSAAPLSAIENIFLHITPTFDVRMDQPIVAAQVEEGSLQDISVTIYNTGQSIVKNIMCFVEMSGFESAGSSFGGDLAIGENKTVTMKTMVSPELDENQEKIYGKTSGVVHVQYEDEMGNVYKQEIIVSSEITSKEPVNDENDDAEWSSQWWVSIVSGLIGIEIIAVILFAVHRRRHI